jgi:hypothetical protein
MEIPRYLITNKKEMANCGIAEYETDHAEGCMALGYGCPKLV